MRYMLDTNICIYAIKNKPETVISNLKMHDPSEICISSITYAELIYGVEKSMAKERNRLALILMFSNIEIMDFGQDAAIEYGRVRADLESRGTLIGNMDMMIAAHGKSLGYTIVTNNVKEFERVKGLVIENWAI